jgi:hypothetical protein
MVFRLRKEARSFFTEIRNTYETDFQSYYFCLMAGLAARRKAAAALTADTVELIDYFPKDFVPTSHLVVALFLRKEIEQYNVSMDERDQVYGIVNRLIDSRAPSCLSDQGFADMNKYAFAGFDILSERFDDKPRSLEMFMIMYHRLVGELAAQA